MTPITAEDFNNRGSVCVYEGKYYEGIDCYNKSIELDPRFTKAYINRAVAYRFMQDYYASLLDCDKAIELDPNYDFAYNLRGEIFDSLNDYSKAIKDFTKATELKEDYLEAYFNRGQLYYQLKDYARAISDYTKIIDFSPSGIEFHYTDGLRYYIKKEKHKDFKETTARILVSPNLAETYFKRGNVNLDMMDLHNALFDYSKAIELCPNKEVPYTNRGIIYTHLGEKFKALLDYNKAIELNPESAEAYNNRGIHFTYEKDIHRAITDYTKAIKLKPNFFEAYFNRSGQYEKLQDYDKAILDLDKALDVRPDDHIVIMKKIAIINKKNATTEEISKCSNDKEIDLKLKETLSSIFGYTQTAEINPDNIRDLFNSGVECYIKKEYSKCILEFTRIIELDSKIAEAYCYRGNSFCIGFQEYEKAILDFTKAIEVDSNYAEPYYLRGLVYSLNDNQSKANEDFKKAYSLGKMEAKDFMDDNTLDSENYLTEPYKEWKIENCLTDPYKEWKMPDVYIMYNSKEMDGYISGAIAKMYYEAQKGIDVYFVPANYNDKEDEYMNRYKDKTVLLLDMFYDLIFMEKIMRTAKKFIWIDNNKEVIEKFEKYLEDKSGSYGKGMWQAVLNKDKATCELTWKHFYPETEIPEVIKLIGEYEEGIKENLIHWNNYILPFKYGMEYKYGSAEDIELGLFKDKELIDDIVCSGRKILRYQEQQDKKACRGSFWTRFDGYNALCLNIGGANFNTFKSKWNPKKYDIAIAFYYSKNHWKYKIFTDKPEIDCLEIVKAYGGKGGKGLGWFYSLTNLLLDDIITEM